MCGIFGYLSSIVKKNSSPTDICISGLKKLEYRGYDSAGIAGLVNGRVGVFKQAGKVAALEALMKKKDTNFTLAIAHTRWATHGGPTSLNAHPHLDEKESLAIVHNGIIENFKEVKDFLKNEGMQFSSETDTEVIAQLLAYHYNKKNLKEAISTALKTLKGTFAIAVVHIDYPNTIFAASRESPLAIGFSDSEQEIFLSSDPNALRKKRLNILYLKDNEVASLQPRSIKIYDLNGNEVEKSSVAFENLSSDVSKGAFDHFMLKEIHDQPKSIQRALQDRLSESFGTTKFEDLKISPQKLQSIDRILILGCGTSYHAGLIAKSLLENIARIPTDAEIASEYRYSNPIISENTLVIAISQSGETADTIAALREVRAKGAKVLALCNVENSTLTRECDSRLLLRAGPEISVCSTKAFTSQITLLLLFTIHMARLRHLSKEEGQEYLSLLQQLPQLASQVLDLSEEIKSLAEKYYKYPSFFFIGRRYMYPSSLEAALKLKEITYLNASGYPGGELKHGPIALIDQSLVTIALCGNDQTYSKILSNIMEVKARNGPLVAFATKKDESLEEACDDVLYLPKVNDVIATVPFSIASQLFAYYIAKLRGTDIDQPRNLAKSVTVE